ncbi:beta-lactamase/transpeptidase-like protein [Aspergillus pseudoustus]|uniref:Beta-lactamase/transpeptidase-like protein n=1 Tax=Aspergillus pseudoustus TaxID=1810923 RepID=A0ABR4IXU3_9EURO
MRTHASLALASLCLPGALANFLAPTYPPPKDLSGSDSAVAAGWRNLTTRLERSLHTRSNTTLSNLRDLTFSIGLFSPHDSGASDLQYHYTAPEVRNATNGTNKVDADSIYRVASVSKLFTVLAGLVELDAADWERPLSELSPTLAESLRESSGTVDPIYDTQWDAITPSALAAQLSGVSHYGQPWTEDLILGYAGAIAANVTVPTVYDPATYGLPTVDLTDPTILSPCSNLEGTCSPEGYYEGVASNPPIFLPWASPAYSNNGLTLLGLAISNLTGKSLQQVYQDAIFDPLGLDSSYSQYPPQSESSRFVVGGALEEGFALDNGLSTPSGGIYSTLNDLTKFGIGILNSTLLTPLQTRRWMKPLTHSASLHYSSGAPWEIYRYTDPKSGIVTDIYTKLGDAGYYGAISAFLPDFDVGFSVLGASSDDHRSGWTLELIQAIVDTLLPALNKQAAKELDEKYAGTYTSTDANLNSTITFASAGTPAAPGLVITNWISNGTDLSPRLPGLLSNDVDKTYRLRPAIVSSDKIAFRAATPPSNPPPRPGDNSKLITDLYDVNDWLLVDGQTYANRALAEFVFDLGDDGSVEGVTPAAWRVRLEKE